MMKLFFSVLIVLCLFSKECMCESRISNSGSGSGIGGGTDDGLYMSSVHSFKSPFTVNDLEKGWVLNYSTASTNKYLVLIPNVYNRRGFLHHSKPIASDNLSIEFTFHIRRKYYKENIDASYYQKDRAKEITYKSTIDEKNKINGFAFWLMTNDFSITKISNEEDIQLDEEEFGLFGYKKSFNGIGVGFQLRGNDLLVSGIINNGEKVININEYITKRHNLHMLSVNELINVKITTQKNEMRIYLYNAKNNTYIQSLTVKKQIPKENYIGFSAFNYKENEKISNTNPEKYIPTFVGITQVTISSSDFSSNNESSNYSFSNNDIIDYEKELNNNMIESDDFNNSTNDTINEVNLNLKQSNKIQGEAYITAMLQKLMAYQINNERKILQNINMLKESVQFLHTELKQMKKYMMNKAEDPKYFQKVFTTELSGLKSLFHSHAQHHKKNIEDITDKLTKRINENQELKFLAEKAQKLETIISKGNNTSYIFSLSFALLIILTLILIYKKIRDVEKKHIL
ncbi:hypothetical protein, conserved [Plasmodium gonderi]|uniref:Uncharacterized protein n=1 Tax=Plasmodium gonderi TaxID=77519 RepID=A0A1Y1JCP3_PLAGO|nr:hypothetical protein, conserved [Plasmodium gonderi]GAW79135.1 hypothetical protein, conserved [Plasmodium gonderi]